MPALTADQARSRLSVYTMEKQALAMTIAQYKVALHRARRRDRKLTEQQQRMLQIIKKERRP